MVLPTLLCPCGRVIERTGKRGRPPDRCPICKAAAPRTHGHRHKAVKPCGLTREEILAKPRVLPGYFDFWKRHGRLVRVPGTVPARYTEASVNEVLRHYDLRASYP